MQPFRANSGQGVPADLNATMTAGSSIPARFPAVLDGRVLHRAPERDLQSEPGSFRRSAYVEPLPGTAQQTDPTFAALLAEVHAACASERVTVFHAAMTPAVPADA